MASVSSLDPLRHGLWCRPSGSDCWVLEILVEDRDGSDWVYRRDRSIRLPATDILARNESGLRYLRPEIQLLYKSKNARPHDDADFAAAWPHLDLNARSWLVTQLQATSPNHPWLTMASAS